MIKLSERFAIPNWGHFVISPSALPGQELHELNLPEELKKEYDAEKVHRKLAQLIRKKEQN